MLTSVPFGAFLLLLGLLWVTKPVAPPHEDDVEDEIEDFEDAQQNYRKARRRQALIGIMRLGLIALGILLLVGNLIAGLGSIDNTGSLALLTAIYGLLLLVVQRAEENRRLATLLLSLVLWLIVIPRYADYRDWTPESNGAIYIALVLNYLFWLVIGRRFPPHSSEEIYVWGMDE